jgi:hypothetical protein
MKIITIVFGFLLPAFAHHGTNITYDVSKTVVLKGTVTEFKFANPHVEIHLDVKDDSGKTVNWNIESAGVYYWSKLGWNKTSLKPGDQVTITLNPARAGTPAGVAVKLVNAAGKEFITETAK